MHFVLSSDENYVPFLGTSILSLLENNNNKYETISIHILSSSISNNNIEKLRFMISTFNACLFIYDMSEIHDKLSNVKIETISISSYNRLFITEILPKDIDRIIYLDCDSLVVGSFRNLWNLDLKGNLIAGVEDMVSNEFKIKINMPLTFKYLNAGMLLMDLKSIREEDWFMKIMEFIGSFQDEIPHHDQGVINGLFYRKALVLNPEYNLMTPFLIMSSIQIKKLYKLNNYYDDQIIAFAIKNPIFIHLTQSLVTRPWVKKSNHLYSKVFKEYLLRTPWKDYKMEKDRSPFNVKFASLLFNYLPFNLWYFVINLKKIIK